MLVTSPSPSGTKTLLRAIAKTRRSLMLVLLLHLHRTVDGGDFGGDKDRSATTTESRMSNQTACASHPVPSGVGLCQKAHSVHTTPSAAVQCATTRGQRIPRPSEHALCRTPCTPRPTCRRRTRPSSRRIRRRPACRRRTWCRTARTSAPSPLRSVSTRSVACTRATSPRARTCRHSASTACWCTLCSVRCRRHTLSRSGRTRLADRTPRPLGLRPERPHHLPGGDTWPVRQNAGRVPRQARLAVKARADDK